MRQCALICGLLGSLTMISGCACATQPGEQSKVANPAQTRQITLSVGMS
jgi:hypothetical protein